MMLTLLDRVGNWNPQLFRELKGRLTLRNVLMVGGLSLGLQLLLLFYFYCLLPSQSNQESVYGDLRWIDWVPWWTHLFSLFNTFLPMTLLVGGVYQLVSDMNQEERHGTLNFIRLSPQSSQSILTGKLLGVPFSIYLGILLAIPLHLRAAIGAKISLGLVLCYYLLLAASCALIYMGVLLCTLAGGIQPWLASVFTLMMTAPILRAINFFFYRLAESLSNYQDFMNWRWFYFPIGFKLSLIYCFILASLMGCVYWVWQFLNRRFRNPSATLLSKQQSYIFALCCHLWMLGFAVPEFGNSSETGYQTVGFVAIFLVIPFGFFVIVAALSPYRQTLQEWARYRPDKLRHPKRFWSKAQIQDLIFGEKSPSIGAVVVHLLITTLIWVPWMLLLPNESSAFPGNHDNVLALVSFLLTANLILICTLLTQLTLLVKARKPQLWAVGVIGTVITLPLASIALFALAPEKKTGPLAAFTDACTCSGICLSDHPLSHYSRSVDGGCFDRATTEKAVAETRRIPIKSTVKCVLSCVENSRNFLF